MVGGTVGEGGGDFCARGPVEHACLTEAVRVAQPAAPGQRFVDPSTAGHNLQEQSRPAQREDAGWRGGHAVGARDGPPVDASPVRCVRSVGAGDDAGVGAEGADEERSVHDRGEQVQRERARHATGSPPAGWTEDG